MPKGFTCTIRLIENWNLISSQVYIVLPTPLNLLLLVQECSSIRDLNDVQLFE